MIKIIIYGVENSHKTTICSKVYELLQAIPSSMGKKVSLKENDFKAVLEINSLELSVFSDILEKQTYHKDISGLKVAIFSAGDDQKTLEEGKEWANSCQCDVFIGTVRKHIHYKKTLSNYNNPEKTIWINIKWLPIHSN